MSYSEASRLIDAYWRELTRKGYTVDEILAKDWGNADREPLVASFQNVLCAVLEQFEEKYSQLKLDANAISINDLFFDFGHYLLDKRLDCNGLDMRYLFVDEFQDTDATQIRTFASLAQTIGARRNIRRLHFHVCKYQLMDLLMQMSVIHRSDHSAHDLRKRYPLL